MTYWSVANDRLWERLVDPRPVVRRAAYGLVSACCRHAPALLLPRPLRDGSPSQPSTQNGGGIGCEAEGTETVQAEWDKGATGGLGKRKGKKRKASRVAAPSLLVQLLGEKEVANHRQAWEAVLLVMEMSKRSWTAEEGAEVRDLLDARFVSLGEGSTRPDLMGVATRCCSSRPIWKECHRCGFVPSMKGGLTGVHLVTNWIFDWLFTKSE